MIEKEGRERERGKRETNIKRPIDASQGGGSRIYKFVKLKKVTFQVV